MLSNYVQAIMFVLHAEILPGHACWCYMLTLPSVLLCCLLLQWASCHGLLELSCECCLYDQHLAADIDSQTSSCVHCHAFHMISSCSGRFPCVLTYRAVFAFHGWPAGSHPTAMLWLASAITHSKLSTQQYIYVSRSRNTTFITCGNLQVRPPG
jgi:hypothetical protein